MNSAGKSPAIFHPLRHLPAVAAALAILLSTAPSTAMDFSGMTDSERTDLGHEIRRYILENPEIVLEAVLKLQQQEEMAEAEQGRAQIDLFSSELFDDKNSWSGGNLNGDITMVEFFDYRCGFCRRSQDIIDELIASDGNIRLVLKEFPILGEDSEFASRIAVSVLQLAGRPAYKRVHDMLITHRGAFDQEVIVEAAELAGLSPEILSEQMYEDSATGILTANHTLALELGINGTPAYVIGGRLVNGFNELEQLRDVVAEERVWQN